MANLIWWAWLRAKQEKNLDPAGQTSAADGRGERSGGETDPGGNLVQWHFSPSPGTMCIPEDIADRAAKKTMGKSPPAPQPHPSHLRSHAPPAGPRRSIFPVSFVRKIARLGQPSCASVMDDTAAAGSETEGQFAFDHAGPRFSAPNASLGDDPVRLQMTGGGKNGGRVAEDCRRSAARDVSSCGRQPQKQARCWWRGGVQSGEAGSASGTALRISGVRQTNLAGRGGAGQ